MVGSVNLFLFCYFGKSATESFQSISNNAFEANWPDIPAHLQRYFILLILNTSKPLQYHGFGVVTLQLETFSQVSAEPLKNYLELIVLDRNFIFFHFIFPVCQCHFHVLFSIQNNLKVLKEICQCSQCNEINFSSMHQAVMWCSVLFRFENENNWYQNEVTMEFDLSAFYKQISSTWCSHHILHAVWHGISFKLSFISSVWR